MTESKRDGKKKVERVSIQVQLRKESTIVYEITKYKSSCRVTIKRKTKESTDSHRKMTRTCTY